MRKNEAEARLAELSPRERDVLQGLVAGKINKVIAHDLEHQSAHGRGLSRQSHGKDRRTQHVGIDADRDGGRFIKR